MNNQDEVEQYVSQLEQENQGLKQQFNQQQGGNMFGVGQEQNLVEWQLDFKRELADIERLLREQKIKKDAEGNEYYEDSDVKDRILNENGVQKIMELLRWYLNKNIVLSNYNQEMINLRVKQFGNSLRRLIFLNYKEYGMDTQYKRKHYETIVMKLVDVVEASYNRALAGGERESLRTARMVNQTQPLNQMQSYPNPQQNKSSKWYNPLSWGR